MKPGLLLNASTVPQVRQRTRQGIPVALNRYVLDYWQHGQKQALVNYNYLREGTALQLVPRRYDEQDCIDGCCHSAAWYVKFRGMLGCPVKESGKSSGVQREVHEIMLFPL